MNMPSLILLLLVFILLEIVLDRKNIIGEKCEHNIRKGKVQKLNGKYRCPQCQEIYENEQRIIAEKREKEIEYKRRASEIQDKFSTMLGQAISLRKQVLVFDEAKIRALSPKDFENFIAVLYTRLGYKVEQTPYANDGGKDAFVYKDGIGYLIECKHYQKDATIGRPMLQKLYAAMTEEHIENGIFIATCDYSRPAIEYGRKTNIKTLGIYDILSMLEEVYNPQTDGNPTYSICCRTCGGEITFTIFDDVEEKTCSNGHIVKNIFWNTRIQEPICHVCGGKYHLVHGRQSTFYGCTNYPNCNSRLSIAEYEEQAGKRKPKKPLLQ